MQFLTAIACLGIWKCGGSGLRFAAMPGTPAVLADAAAASRTKNAAIPSMGGGVRNKEEKKIKAI